MQADLMETTKTLHALHGQPLETSMESARFIGQEEENSQSQSPFLHMYW